MRIRLALFTLLLTACSLLAQEPVIAIRFTGPADAIKASTTATGLRVEAPAGVSLVPEKLPAGGIPNFAVDNGKAVLEVPLADISKYRVTIDSSKVVVLLADAPTDSATALDLADRRREKLLTDFKATNWDRPIPESPAFVALGLTPETVTRPSTPREFGSALMNGLDAQGNFKSGIAIDVAPFQVFAGKNVTIEDYRSSWFTRFLFNSQLSIATAKGVTEDDKSLRAAVGLNLTIFDEGDPRLNPAITEAYSVYDSQFALPRRNPFKPEDPKPFEDYLMKSNQGEDDLQKRVGELRKRLWSQSSWTVALAPTFSSKTADSDDLRFEGFQGWTSFAYGFKNASLLRDKAQLIVNGRFRLNEYVFDEATKALLYKEDSFVGGLRFRFGLPDFNGSVEASYIRSWTSIGNDHSYRLAVGIEKKIAQNVWLNMSFGKNVDQDLAAKKDAAYIVGALRFAVSEKATIQ